jgi:hypothetical protein
MVVGFMGMETNKNKKAFKWILIAGASFILLLTLWVFPTFVYGAAQTEPVKNGGSDVSFAPLSTTTTKPGPTTTTTTTTKPTPTSTLTPIPTTTVTTTTTTPKPLSVTKTDVQEANGIYGGTVNLSATLTSDGSPVSGKTINFALGGTSAGDAVTNSSGIAALAEVNLSGLSAGTYANGVEASFSGDSNYKESTGTGILTVNPIGLTVTADDQSKVYGDDDPDLTYQITSGSLAGKDAFIGTLARAAGESAGTYAIQQGTLTAGSNYDLTFVEGTLSITPRPLTVTADDQSKIYGDDDPDLTYQVTSGSLAGGDTFSGTLARAAGESTGTYAIQQDTLTAGSNYDLTFVEGTLSITPRPLTVTADDQSKVYGDDDPDLTYKITSGSLAGGDTFSGTPARAAGESVGTYAIQQGTLTAGGNYDLTFVEGTLSITPRPLTVTADDQSKVYGDDDPDLTYQITSGSLIGEDAFSGTLARAAGESVGTYAIQQRTLTAGSNYDLTFVEGTFAITPILKINISGGGSVNISNNGPYEIGAIIQLMAYPAVGWVFSGWSGDLEGFDNPAVITMDGNKVITTTFIWVGDGGGGGGGGDEGGGDENSGDEEDKNTDSTLPDGTADVTEMINPEGRFTSTLTEVSPDNVCALTIPTDTLGVDKDLKPLTQISIVPVANPPAPAAQSVIGLPYSLKPEGTTFDRLVTIALSYDPAKIPAGVNEQDLVLAFYDNTIHQWVALTDIVVDKLTRTVSGKTDRFAVFSVIAYSRPATFTASALAVYPDKTTIGGSVSISVKIANTGDLTGSYDVILKINDELAETRRVTISGHAEQGVIFIVNTDVAGNFTVAIDNLTGTFTVQAVQRVSNSKVTLTPTLEPNTAPAVTPTSAASLTPAEASTVPPTTTPEPNQASTNWDVVLGLATAALILIVILIRWS